MIIEREKIDDNIIKIAARLMDAGRKAYLVGGAVRDIVFGREPQDFDLLTDATCLEIKKLFRNVVAYGMKHGTAIVVMEKKPYDLTSFKDGDAPAGDLENDLATRDFTINAMACDMADMKLLDPFGGLSDFSNKSIKCVLNPEDRFNKDPLRLLRAVRQAARFGFSIEDKTFSAMKELSPKIVTSAPERIASEIMKLFDAEKSGRCIDYMVKSGIWKSLAEKFFGVYFPRLDLAGFDLKASFFKGFTCLPPENAVLKLSFFILYFLHSCGGTKLFEIDMKSVARCLHSMKFARSEFEPASALVFIAASEFRNSCRNNFKAGDDLITAKKDMLGYYKLSKQKDICKDVYILCENFFAAAGEAGNAMRFASLSEALERVAVENHPVFLEDLAIDGEMLKQVFGMGECHRIGEMLKFAQNEAVVDKSANTREELIARIRSKLIKH